MLTTKSGDVDRFSIPRADQSLKSCVELCNSLESGHPNSLEVLGAFMVKATESTAWGFAARDRQLSIGAEGTFGTPESVVWDSETR